MPNRMIKSSLATPDDDVPGPYDGADWSFSSNLDCANDDTATEVAVIAEVAAMSVSRATNNAAPDILDRANPYLVAWAKWRMAEMLTRDGNGNPISDVTREMIRQTLIDGYLHDRSFDEIARRLVMSHGFNNMKAALIVRTEIQNAAGAGLLIAYKNGGMTKKRWLLSNCSDVCTLCLANAAQGWIDINEAFISGAQHPVQHPNCRCDLGARHD